MVEVKNDSRRSHTAEYSHLNTATVKDFIFFFSPWVIYSNSRLCVDIYCCVADNPLREKSGCFARVEKV